MGVAKDEVKKTSIVNGSGMGPGLRNVSMTLVTTSWTITKLPTNARCEASEFGPFPRNFTPLVLVIAYKWENKINGDHNSFTDFDK